MTAPAIPILRRIGTVLLTVIPLAVANAKQDPLERLDAAIDSFNVPVDAYASCLEKELALEIRGDINPFLISGDFDGDHQLDYAFLVKEQASGKRGVLVCLTSKMRRVRLGAGQKWRGDDDFDLYDAWSVMPSREARKVLGRAVQVDGIVLKIKEKSATLAFWDGQQFASKWWESVPEPSIRGRSLR